MKANETNLDYIKYLGTKYLYEGNSIREGYDCINLCCALAKDRNIKMKNINHSYCDINSYHHLFNLRNTQEFLKVKPQKDVLVVFKIAGKISHVGYMLDNTSFIHIMENSSVTVEKITNANWEKRVIGFYKYVGD